MTGDDGKRARNIRYETNNWWTLIVNVEEMGSHEDISEAIYTILSRSHRVSLWSNAESLLSFMWRSEWVRETDFIHRIFIKHQPHDHLLHVFPLPIARVKKEWRETLDHLQMEPSTPNDSLICFLLLASFLPDHFTDTLHKNTRRSVFFFFVV